MFPERFSNLPEYAFPRLRALLDAHEPAEAYSDDIVNMIAVTALQASTGDA